MVEATPSSLDLFKKNIVQTAITDGTWVEIRPINSIEETAPVDFHIDGTSEDFVDLSETYLKIKACVTTAAGDAGYPDDQMVAPINLILQSMWSKLDVSFNGKRVSSSGHTYPYRAYRSLEPGKRCEGRPTFCFGMAHGLPRTFRYIGRRKFRFHRPQRVRTWTEDHKPDGSFAC